MRAAPPPPSSIRPSPMGGPPPGPPPDPTAGPISPAPPQLAPGALGFVMKVKALTDGLREIAMESPAAVPFIQDINLKIQEMVQAVVSSMPPTETAAPPV